MKTLCAAVLIAVLGAVAAYAQTDGFTVLTTEAARRADIARQPRAIPPANVHRADGNVLPLRSLLADDGRIAIVNFIYTRCISLCVSMGTEFQQLQQAIVRRGLADRVRLVSISFDPRDTAPWLARYQERMRIDTDVWDAVAVMDPAQRDMLLAAFGIIVVPAPLGQYEHNAAYHVVTPDGRLSRIVDIEQAGDALYYALAMSETGARAADPAGMP